MIGMEPNLKGDGPSNIFTEEATNKDCSDHSRSPKEKLVQPFFFSRSIVRALVGF